MSASNQYDIVIVAMLCPTLIIIAAILAWVLRGDR